MRSQDAVWGMPYDMFTFSAIGKYMQVYLWMAKNFGVGLGKLYVRAGSFHIYERHFDDAEAWLETSEENSAHKAYLKACSCINPQDFISNLVHAAQHSKGQQVSK
jgi:thymidylate synthase